MRHSLVVRLRMLDTGGGRSKLTKERGKLERLRGIRKVEEEDEDEDEAKSSKEFDARWRGRKEESCRGAKR